MVILTELLDDDAHPPAALAADLLALAEVRSLVISEPAGRRPVAQSSIARLRASFEALVADEPSTAADARRHLSVRFRLW